MSLTGKQLAPLGKLKGADFNSTADQAIPINAARYIVRRIIAVGATVSLTTAAGGLYTGASKTGTTLVGAAQTYAALTAASKFLDLTLDAGLGTDVLTASQVFLSLTVAQGSAALADVYLFGDVLP